MDRMTSWREIEEEGEGEGEGGERDCQCYRHKRTETYERTDGQQSKQQYMQ